MILNPFIDDECANGCGLPAICTDQPLEGGESVFSEICGLIVLPKNAPPPTNWQTEGGWAGIIDNASTATTAGKYLAVMGSFEPSEAEAAALAGGRGFVNLGRRWRLTAEAKDIGPGERCVLRELDSSHRTFRFWLETRGGRMIGGPSGLVPIQRSAAQPFQRGGLERADIAVDFFMLRMFDVGQAPYIPTTPPPTVVCENYLESVNGLAMISVNTQCLEPI